MQNRQIFLKFEVFLKKEDAPKKAPIHLIFLKTFKMQISWGNASWNWEFKAEGSGVQYST